MALCLLLTGYSKKKNETCVFKTVADIRIKFVNSKRFRQNDGKKYLNV